jgi:CheY-like chemotaxis protein
VSPPVRDRVLVIDDDPDFRELMEGLLSAFGLRFSSASDCESALALLHRERTHLRAILLDYWMPGCSPAACAAALREVVGAEVPIVLVTASNDAGLRAAELKLERWLAKPFSPAALRRELGLGSA